MARLRVNDGGIAFDVYLDDKLRVRLGRADDCEVTIEDKEASRLHAEVTLTDAGFVLVDHGSANGTTVNGRPVKRHPLRDGDVIGIGTARMKFSDPDEAERLRAAAAAGVLPVGIDEEPAPPARSPSGRRPAAGSGRTAAASGRTTSPSGRRPAASGRHRVSGRQGARKRGMDTTLIGGGLLAVGLVAVIALVMSSRGNASREALGVLDDAKALAGKHKYQEAIKRLGRMPPNAPHDVVQRARALQREWRARIGGPAAPAADAPTGGNVGLGGLGGTGTSAAAAGAVGDAAFATLAAADAAAHTAVLAGHFGDAVAAYDGVIAKHPDTDAAGQAATHRQKILDDAEALWQSRHARATALLTDRQFDEARKIYRRIADEFGLPEYVKRAKDRLDYVNDLAMQ